MNLLIAFNICANATEIYRYAVFPSQRVIANIEPIGTTDVAYLKQWNFIRLMWKITEHVEKYSHKLYVENYKNGFRTR